MDKIRVLLAEMPRMWRDVFRWVMDNADMEIVGDFSDPIALLLAARQTQVDIVVIGMVDSDLPGICSHLFDENPHVKILAVERDGRAAFLYGLGIQRVTLSDTSTEGLLHAVRTAVHSHLA